MKYPILYIDMGITKWLAWILPVASLAFAISQVHDLPGYLQILQATRGF